MNENDRARGRGKSQIKKNRGELLSFNWNENCSKNLCIRTMSLGINE